MRHWTYYTRVFSFLERIEARQAKNTPTGAYLVWRDDDGPVMVAGPDIDWFRGNGRSPTYRVSIWPLKKPADPETQQQR